MLFRAPRPFLHLVLPCLAIASCVRGSATRPAVEPGADGVEVGGAELGSTRNSRIAFPMAAGRAELTFLAGTLSEEELAALRASAPNLRVVASPSQAEALRLAPEAHGIDGRYCTSEFLRSASKLCWVQASSAGVERYLALPELAGSGRIVLTNMKGMHGPAIADHVFAMLLALTRSLVPQLDAGQQAARERTGLGRDPIALEGRALLVVGLGGIGSEVARRAKGFGMRVLATRKSDTPPPPYVELQRGPEGMLELLPQADVVVLCVPLTSETEGMIGARELAAFKPGAYLVNVARGRLVDTAALVAALEAGRLAGACLDVTDPEPLPSDHPLRKMPNVILTPHVAARAALTEQRVHGLYLENLRRFGAGEPLLNVVDKAAGY